MWQPHPDRGVSPSWTTWCPCQLREYWSRNVHASSSARVAAEAYDWIGRAFVCLVTRPSWTLVAMAADQDTYD
jgi:hypothetical protein